LEGVEESGSGLAAGSACAGSLGSSGGSSDSEGGEVRAGPDPSGLLRMDIMEYYKILRHGTMESVSSSSIGHGKISRSQARAKLQNRINEVVATAHSLGLTMLALLDTILKHGS